MPNKPLAIMAADVKIQTFALRKNISDYSQCSLLEAATIASAKTLGAIAALLAPNVRAVTPRSRDLSLPRQLPTSRLAPFPL